MREKWIIKKIFFIKDLAIKYGQGEFNFPERIENIYKVLGRVRNYKYSDTDEAEPYNYNKNNSLLVPPSYIDTFFRLLLVLVSCFYHVPLFR